MNGKEWINSTNVYEVNVRQYSKDGTFNAFIPHLPRLKDMGVQTLWFMPITPISQLNKKGSMGSYYACSDYVAVNPEFGDLDDFKDLVNKAHDMGFRVIIDWVANHTGWDHVWTKEHPDWFEKDETGNFKKASGMDDIIELDFKNADMRKAMIEAMKFWVSETGIDGFRCDLAFWVELDFWLEAIPQLNAVKPLFWLAEADPLDHPDYMQVFDAAYSWAWMHQTEDYVRKKIDFTTLLTTLEKYEAAPGIKAWFTSNHDENTWNGTEYEKYGIFAKALAVFSCTWQGIPLIYTGQELPNMKRLEFFEKDAVEWTGNFELHSFYKSLLTLQTTHPALKTYVPVKGISGLPYGVLGYRRVEANSEIIVFMNLHDQVTRFPMPVWISGIAKNVFTMQEASLPAELFLKPGEYFVWQR